MHPKRSLFIGLVFTLGFSVAIFRSVTVFGQTPPAPAPTAPAVGGAPADPAQPTNSQGDAAGKSPFQAPSAASILSTFMQPFPYDPQGRKDPFQPPVVDRPMPPGAFHGPVLPLQSFRLEQLTLIGIIWDVAKPRAMFRDSNGRVHVVGVNAKIGSQNGYVAAIREGEVVVIETFEEDGKLYSAARIVRLATNQQANTR